MVQLGVEAQVHKLLRSRNFEIGSIFTVDDIVKFLPNLKGQESKISHYIHKMRARKAIRSIGKYNEVWSYKLESRKDLESRPFDSVSSPVMETEI